MKKLYIIASLNIIFLQANPQENQPVTRAVWSHGWGPASQKDVQDNCIFYQNHSCLPKTTLFPVYEDANQGNLLKTYLGQGKDITDLAARCDIQNQNGSYFLYGISRGAAASLHFVATNKHQENLRALVLESGPADILQTNNTRKIENILGFHLPSWLLAPIVYCISKGRFPRAPINTLDAIQKIENKNLPILILHGEQDTLIEPDHAYKLYMTLKKAGFKSVYLRICKEGQHCNTFLTTQAQETIKQFYTAYNINPTSAATSYTQEEKTNALNALQKNCQPSLDNITNLHNILVTQQQQEQKRLMQPAQKRNKLIAAATATSLIALKILSNT